MSDPYNSYGAHVPPAAPAAVPVAPPVRKAKPDVITYLQVSERWKEKFRLIERAGGPDLPQFRELLSGERFAVTFNILCILFGPIYLLVKGLWRQAITYMALFFALVFLLELLGLGRYGRGVGYFLSFTYGWRANVSYYKKVVLGDPPWFW